jgi:hypothetical protein
MDSLAIQYQHFVSLIKNEFFSWDNVGETVVLSVDQRILNKIFPDLRDDISEVLNPLWEYISSDWGILEGSYEKVPKCLGFLALQCLIASQMQEDKEFSENEYNKRLQTQLGIISSQQLQKLYAKYQENFWISVKCWAEEDFFAFPIPEKKSGAGRFCQYPLSHTLLRQRDLNELTAYFVKCGLRLYDTSFSDFIELVFQDPKWLRSKLQQKYDEDRIYKQIIQEQAFSFFQTWKGEDLSKPENESERFYESQRDQYQQRLILNLQQYNPDEDNPNIKLVLKPKWISFDLQHTDFFQKIRQERQLYWPENIVFFEYDTNNEEGEEVSFLRPDTGYKVLVSRYNLNHFLKQDLELLNHETVIRLENYTIYDILFSENTDIGDHLKKFIKQKHPFKLSGGLKLDRHIYLQGWGPRLQIFDATTKIFINGNKHELENGEINLQHYPVGVYQLKITHVAPINIEIKKASTSKIQPQKGWQISKDSYGFSEKSEKWAISGLQHTEIENIPPVARQFLNLKRKVPVSQESLSGIMRYTCSLKRRK